MTGQQLVKQILKFIFLLGQAKNNAVIMEKNAFQFKMS